MKRVLSILALVPAFAFLLLNCPAHADTLYVSCSTNGLIPRPPGLQIPMYQVSPTGTLTALPNQIGGGPFVFDATGNIYQQAGGYEFLKTTPAGIMTTIAKLPLPAMPNSGKINASTPNMSAILSLALDSHGNLFAVNYYGTVDKITPSGVVTAFATFPSTARMYGMAIDCNDNVFVTSFSGQISKISPQGVVSNFVTLQYGLGPTGLVFDKNGNLFVSCDAERIEKITPKGEVSQFALLAGRSGLPPMFNANSITIDTSGNLYVTGGGSIEKISSDGATVTVLVPKTSFRVSGTSPPFHNIPAKKYAGFLDPIYLAFPPTPAQPVITPHP